MHPAGLAGYQGLPCSPVQLPSTDASSWTGWTSRVALQPHAAPFNRCIQLDRLDIKEGAMQSHEAKT